MGVNDLADSQVEARLKKYQTIESSDSIQVMVFQPNSTTFKAAWLMYLWPLLDGLWVLFPTFLAQNTNTNIEKDPSLLWGGH